MNGMNARERRLVALAILIALLAGLWLGVAAPIADGFGQRQAERQTLLAAYRRNTRIIDSVAAWRVQAEAQKRTQGAMALIAPSDVQAREALKQRIAAAILAVGAERPTVQDVQADLPAGWIGARADAQLTQAQLNDSLRRLESEQPYVIVNYLSINAEQAFRSGHAGPLEVRLELAVPFRPAPAGQP
jgi:general secretion pathway protein M